MLSLILTFLALVLLGIFVVSKFSKNSRGWFVLFLICFYAIWASSNFLYSRVDDHELILFFSRLSFSSTYLLSWGFAFLALAVSISPLYRNFGFTWLSFLGLWVAFGVYQALFTNSFILGLKYSYEIGGYVLAFNSPLYSHYLFYILVSFVLSLGLLCFKYKRGGKSILVQCKGLVLVSVLGFVGMFFTNVLLPTVYTNPQYTDIGPFLALPILGTLCVLSMTQNPKDLSYLFCRGVSFIVKVFSVFFAIIALVLFLSQFLQLDMGGALDEILVFSIFLSVMIVYMLAKIENRGFLEASRKGDYFNYLEERISLELDIDKLQGFVAKYIKSSFGVLDVFIFLKGSGPEFFEYKTGGESFGEDDVFIMENFLGMIGFWQSLTKRSFLNRENLEKMAVSFRGEKANKINNILASMKKARVDLIMPLNDSKGLNGFIIIGEKTNNSSFGEDDEGLLSKIMRISLLAFSRAFIYEELNNVNKDFGGRVDEHTEQLSKKMDNVRDMSSRERDLLGIMGHEIRTPITIAKNAVEMIDLYKKDHEKAGKTVIWNKDFDKQFNYIKIALERETVIVETLLAATKLEAERMEANFTKVDLVRVLESTRVAFEKEAQKKGLIFKMGIDKNRDWFVRADMFRVQQIIDNLVSNAVKYTSQGSVKISLHDLDKEIGVFIRDTGQGIAPEDIKNLGKKFYRARQYIGEDMSEREGVVRPDGMGLGLYVVFGLTRLMNGRYEIESKEGRGSVFKVFFKKLD